MIALLLAAAIVPATPKKPVVHAYQGVKVSDDYEWLENDADAKVKKWSEAQNAAARAFLDKIPGRAALHKRIDALVRETSASFYGIVDRRGRSFAGRADPKQQQPYIVSLPDLEHPEQARAVVDPNAIDSTGHTAIDFFVVSLDGTKIAVSLSKGGTESGDVQVYDAASGAEIDAPVPRVNSGTAGGSVAWNADATGFWYTRNPRGTERKPEDMGFYQQIYFHKLGTPTDQDTYELGKELPRIAEITLDTTDDGTYVLASVKNGDGGEVEFFVRGAAGWTQISQFDDKIVHAEVGVDGAAYLLSRKDAPKGKILRLPLETPQLAKAVEVVPQGEGGIHDLLTTAQKLY